MPCGAVRCGVVQCGAAPAGIDRFIIARTEQISAAAPYPLHVACCNDNRAACVRACGQRAGWASAIGIARAVGHAVQYVHRRSQRMRGALSDLPMRVCVWACTRLRACLEACGRRLKACTHANNVLPPVR
jgi:hypothetical protein